MVEITKKLGYNDIKIEKNYRNKEELEQKNQIERE